MLLLATDTEKSPVMGGSDPDFPFQQFACTRRIPLNPKIQNGNIRARTGDQHDRKS